MSKSIWKGTIAFGLIRIPVKLQTAERRSRPAFAMLDRRNHAHVGYRRVNDMTGEEVPWEEVVSGYEYEPGTYVEVAEEDIRGVTPRTYHAVRIEDFVHRDEIPAVYFSKPYYLAPEPEGRRAYALLRAVIEESGTVGVCRVVIQSREHLAALTSYFHVLTLTVMRYHDELQMPEEIDVPRGETGEDVSGRDHADARRLVDAMTVGWNPVRYPDRYGRQLTSWIERKVRQARQEYHELSVAEEEEVEARAANVLDMTELLRRSIERRRSGREHTELRRRAGH